MKLELDTFLTCSGLRGLRRTKCRTCSIEDFKNCMGNKTDCALALRKINTKPHELSSCFQFLQIPLTHPTQLVHWLRLFRTERCRNKTTAPTSVFVLGVVLFPSRKCRSRPHTRTPMEWQIEKGANRFYLCYFRPTQTLPILSSLSYKSKFGLCFEWTV